MVYVFDVWKHRILNLKEIKIRKSSSDLVCL